MSKLLVLFIFFGNLFQVFFCFDRSEIANEFQPILQDKVVNYSEEHDQTAIEYDLVVTQIQNATWAEMARMTSVIIDLQNQIATDITNAQNISANNTVTCLTNQQAASASLTAVPLNNTCWAGVSFTNLSDARDVFSILATAANETITACDSLNPLSGQDEEFLDCITHKLLDLDEQYEMEKVKFETIKEQYLSDNTECLSQQDEIINQQIAEINYEVALCLN